MLWMAVCLIVSFTGCTSEEMDYNNPDVALFVKQLKSGTYKMKNEKGVVEVPHFTEEDIPELLKYAEDLTIIPSFPSVYNMNNGKIRLGECMLWVIESIRQGTPPSLGCKMVLMRKYSMQPLVIVVGGKNANIRKRDGQLIRVTMSRFVDRVIVGGNKGGGAFGK